VEDVWKMCGRCVEDVWKMCGRCVEDVLRVKKESKDRLLIVSIVVTQRGRSEDLLQQFDSTI
jgi:hypothetical protein